MKAITPNELRQRSIELPEEVVAAVNMLIVNNWEGTKSTFYKSALIQLIQEKFHQAGKICTKQEVIDADYQMQIEQMYKTEGWKISTNDIKWQFTYSNSIYIV